jgi:hypothetical protein
VVRVRHFPNEQAALKCVYMAIMSLDPTGTRTTALDDALEARPQRLRYRLRRPPVRKPTLDPTDISYTNLFNPAGRSGLQP